MSIKKYIADKLKEKFEGVEDDVISRVSVAAAKNCKDEDEADSYIEKLTIHALYKSYTDSRVTDSANKAIKTYESKYGLKDGAKVKKSIEDDDEDDDDDEDEPKPKNKKHKGGDEMPAWAKALNDKLDRLENSKTTENRKSRLTEALKDVNEKSRASFMQNFSRMSFKDDEDFDNWLDTDVKTFANEAIKQQKINESHVGAPKAGRTDNTKEISPILKARIEAAEKETDEPSALRGLN